MLSPDALHLAIGTVVPHRNDITGAYYRSLVDAAADAGFSGIEFWMKHHDSAVADDMTSEEFFAYPREKGLAIVAAEMADGWRTPDPKAVAEATTHLLDLTVAAGAPITLAIAREITDFGDTVAGMRILCDLAADRGLQISLEALPFPGVGIQTAARLFEEVDRDNLGLCLDPWHWFRQESGPDVATLRSIPPERITVLQLDDATAEPEGELIVETMTKRRLPGDGVVDIMEMLDVLDEIGATPFVVSEVFSAELWELGVEENARRQYAASRALLERHAAAKA